MCCSPLWGDFAAISIAIDVGVMSKTRPLNSLNPLDVRHTVRK